MTDATYQAIAVWSEVISSVVFLAAMIYIWMRFVAPAVLASQARKNAELADAEKRRDETVAEAERARAEIATAESDAAAIVARAESDAAALHERIVAGGRAEGDRLMRNARGELDRSRVAASAELRDELLGSALRIARSRAVDLDGNADRRLMERALAAADPGPFD